MAKRKKPPELTFQEHVADFLVRQHEYGVLEQSDITDTEHFIAEDQLWAFLKATQSDTLKKLTDDYGTDARDEVFRALRKELAHSPLWMLFRERLNVRGLEFHLYYPKPRSAESAAVGKYGDNRITFRPHFYFGETNQEIDFVFFLNGLPIVALELKHEKNQTVYDAVAQFAVRDHARKIFQHPFLYLAADTSDVMAATDPRREQNFRWHNIEFARRRIKPEGAKIETPADLLPHVRHYADRKQEHFLCATINGANEILNIRVVSIGLIDRSPVHPREVFADALADRASAVIVAHNHPTGQLEPSSGDVNITAQLKAAGAIVGIELLDHIIFNRTGYFSFLEDGRL